MDIVANLFASRTGLSAEQTRQLQALAQILSMQQTTASPAGKPTRAELSVDQQNLIGRFLVAIAASRGPINRTTAAALRNTFKTLGIDIPLLKRQLAEQRKQEQEPVEVTREKKSTRPGELIPPRAQTTLAALLLNDDRIRQLLDETQDAARLLAEVMLDDWPDEPSSETHVEIANTPNRAGFVSVKSLELEGLDRRYVPAVVELSHGSAWPQAEFDAIARRHQLMPSSLFDVVNEWAIEVFGDMLLEQHGDDILFHKDLITVQR